MADTHQKFAKVLFPYSSSSNGADGVMDVSQGDIVEVITNSGDWTYVRNQTTNLSGYVPTNFLEMSQTSNTSQQELHIKSNHLKQTQKELTPQSHKQNNKDNPTVGNSIANARNEQNTSTTNDDDGESSDEDFEVTVGKKSDKASNTCTNPIPLSNSLTEQHTLTTSETCLGEKNSSRNSQETPSSATTHLSSPNAEKNATAPGSGTSTENPTTTTAATTSSYIQERNRTSSKIAPSEFSKVKLLWQRNLEKGPSEIKTPPKKNPVSVHSRVKSFNPSSTTSSQSTFSKSFRLDNNSTTNCNSPSDVEPSAMSPSKDESKEQKKNFKPGKLNIGELSKSLGAKISPNHAISISSTGDGLKSSPMSSDSSSSTHNDSVTSPLSPANHIRTPRIAPSSNNQESRTTSGLNRTGSIKINEMRSKLSSLIQPPGVNMGRVPVVAMTHNSIIKPEQLAKYKIIENAMLSIIRRKRLKEYVRSSPDLKQARLRKSFIQEVYSTECSYINGLQVAVNVFLNPLSQKKIIPDEHIQQLFGSIEHILNIQKTILAKLEMEMKKDVPLIGAVFKELTPFLKVYTDYVNNYDNAQELYEQLKSKKRKFTAFLEKTFSDPRCQGLDLPAFLIQPVQRIPRYRLLLQDIVKNTPFDHVDMGNLEVALKIVIDCANFVNERKRENENSKLISEISQRFDEQFVSNLLQPHRILHKRLTVSQIMCSTISIDEKGILETFISKENCLCYLFSDIALFLLDNKPKPPYYQLHLGFTRIAKESNSENGVTIEFITGFKGQKCRVTISIAADQQSCIDIFRDYILQTKKRNCSKISIQDVSQWDDIYQKHLQISSELPSKQKKVDDLTEKQQIIETQLSQIQTIIAEKKEELEKLKKEIFEKEARMKALLKFQIKYSDDLTLLNTSIGESQKYLEDSASKIVRITNNDEVVLAEVFNEKPQ